MKKLLSIATLCCSVLSAKACVTPWGSGLTEQPSGLSKIANGVVVVLDSAGFAVASARLTGAMSASFGDGLALATADPPQERVLSPRFPDWALSLGGQAYPGFGTLAATVGGPTLEVTFDTLAADVILTRADGFSCFGLVSGDDLRLSTRLALESNKAGALEVSVLDEPSWHEPLPSLDIADCVNTLTGDPQTTDAIVNDLLAVVGSRLLSDMAAPLESTLPELLGVKLGTRLSVSMVDAGQGEGTAEFEITAPEGLGDEPWAFANDHLYVFFSLGMNGSRHDCVPPPETDLPALQSLPVPSTAQGDSTMFMVNELAVLRGMKLLWMAGRFCGDRALGDLELPWFLAEGGWPELEALGQHELTVRVWPQSELQTQFTSSTDGTPRVVVATSSLRVELFTMIEDTRVLATALTVDVTIEGELVVNADGSVGFDGDSITVDGVDAVDSGIVPAPSDVLAAVGEPLAAALIDEVPLWQLPDLPVASTVPDIRRVDGYLIFAWPGQQQ